jgi:hypothetical protein
MAHIETLKADNEQLAVQLLKVKAQADRANAELTAMARPRDNANSATPDAPPASKPASLLSNACRLPWRPCVGGAVLLLVGILPTN